MPYKTLLIILFTLLNLSAQEFIDPSSLYSNFATSERQEKEYTSAKTFVQNTLSAPLGNDNSLQWRMALEKAQLYYIKTDLVKNSIRTALQNFSSKDEYFVIVAMETAKTLYGFEFENEIKNIIELTDKLGIFAFAANCTNTLDNNIILSHLERFDNTSPIYKCLEYQLTTPDSLKFKNRPPLDDILKYQFEEGATIIYSIFRSDRTQPGISIIKGPDGEFVKNEDGSVFNIPQFSCSYADVPGYVKNGNTPEGIFSIVGTYISPTESIGPSTNVLTRIPFEVPTDIFYHNKHKYNYWTKEEYINLLPETWRDYFPMYETFYSGKSGRRVIVMHGSTDDLRFFTDKEYYPHTPTKGCISSIEFWNPNTGQNTRSDQTKLINAFLSTGNLQGYLVVIEIDDKNTPVKIDDIKQYLP